MSIPFSPAAPAPVGALFTTQGLNAVYLGQPVSLRLRLAYTPGGDTGPVTVALDVAAAGATPPSSPAPTVPGGAVPVANPGSLTWQWWPTGEMLEVALPELTFEGEAGLRAVPLTVRHGSSEPARLALPLLCLRPAPDSAAPAQQVVTEVLHANLAGPGEGEAGRGTVALRMSYPLPPAKAKATPPTFYLLLSEGLLPGQEALATPGAAEAIELSLGQESAWQVSRLPDVVYPAWRLQLRAGQALPPGPLDMQLHHLRLRQPARGRAHLLVYGVAVPGTADGGQVVSLRWPGPTDTLQAGNGDGDVSIVRFEASPTTLSMPGTVRLSWQVRNADYVTISGIGKVPAEASDRAVVVEETTTFVLLAYGAGLSQLESRTLQVQVAASRQMVRGTILLWSGQLTNLPPGWALCDGTDGRPDLRDRFVLGAGGRAKPHERGEPDTHTHEMKGYTITGRTEEDGQHTHRMPEKWYDRNYSPGDYTSVDVGGISVKNQHTQEDGKHSHEISLKIPTVTTDPSDSANRPAWYSLCYIVKL